MFPVGMYAACSFVVGAAAHAGAITSFARVWVWVALAVWAVVFVGLIRRATETGDVQSYQTTELVTRRPRA